MKESPLIHSSANRPLSRNRPSELELPPLVAELRRPIAPMRTALAPAADCTSDGLMISGSVTCNTSLGVQATAATASVVMTTARRHPLPVCDVIYEVIDVLEAEGEAERIEG